MGGISFKFRFFIVTLFISICGSSNFEEDGFSAQDGAFYLNDAVILNAPAVRLTREADNSTRDGKQWLLLQPRQQIDEEAFGQNCLTTMGKKGTCKSFHECFPLLKVADLSGGDGWVMGHYDTCSYVNGDNTEVFGVCCTEPVDTPPQETPDIQRLIQSTHALPYQSISALPFGTGIGQDYATLRQIPIGWPPAIPPLPTHPPDHTAPTHPPLFIAGIITPTTQRPAGYPTWPPATARPTIPSTTRPPLGIINPTAPTQSPVVDGSCGIKNGPQTYESAYDPQDEERIVGGHNADLNEWPWIAVLFNGGRQFCGGSLIDNIHVLTAAHCIAHMTSWDVARLSVRLGDYNIRTNAETQHIERKIKRIVRHRGFNIQTLHNDISILTLDHPVKFTKNIRPVCLPGPGKAYSGAFATVIGWGSLRESGPQPSILQEVTIPIWTNSDCRLRYGPAAPGGIVDHMLCAGRNSMDSCSGDSGGPLTINEGGRWTQVGVVSWGIGCGKGQYPGVYTRVTSFLPWIQKNTMNN